MLLALLLLLLLWLFVEEEEEDAPPPSMVGLVCVSCRGELCSKCFLAGNELVNQRLHLNSAKSS